MDLYAPQCHKAQIAATFCSASSDPICGSFIGYLGLGAENVGASAGSASALPDAVESLSLSGFQDAGQEWRWDAESAPPPWADMPYATALPPELRRAAAAYWAGATSLLRALMALSEVALELPTGHFDEASAAHRDQSPGGMRAYTPANGLEWAFFHPSPSPFSSQPHPSPIPAPPQPHLRIRR